jgi:flagellar biogenesis protein FliO
MPPLLFYLQSADGPGSWIGYVKFVLVLGALLCLTYVLAQLVSRRLSLLRGRSGGGVLAIVDRMNLEPRRTVYVVRAGSQYLAVASSEHGVHLLTRLEPAGIPEPATQAASPGRGV